MAVAARRRFLGFVVVALAGAAVFASAVVGARARVVAAHREADVSSAEPANGESSPVAISADGRFVAFQSTASNLVPGDTNEATDMFVGDRVSGTIERVSVSGSGAQANDSSDGSAAISADGRFVAFPSRASNLVAGLTKRERACFDAGRGQFSCSDVFVRDRLLKTTERVSVSTSGRQANGDSFPDAISADGRFLAFSSTASNLVAGDTNDCIFWNGVHYNCSDVFMRDRLAGKTERVSVSSGGTQADVDSHGAGMSANGRFVAFGSSWANDCVAPDGSHYECEGVFVRDRLAGTTERVSVTSNGEPASASLPVISADGRFGTKCVVVPACRRPEGRRPVPTRPVGGHDRAREREQQRRAGQ